MRQLNNMAFGIEFIRKLNVDKNLIMNFLKNAWDRVICPGAVLNERLVGLTTLGE